MPAEPVPGRHPCRLSPGAAPGCPPSRSPRTWSGWTRPPCCARSWPTSSMRPAPGGTCGSAWAWRRAAVEWVLRDQVPYGVRAMPRYPAETATGDPAAVLAAVGAAVAADAADAARRGAGWSSWSGTGRRIRFACRPRWPRRWCCTASTPCSTGQPPDGQGAVLAAGAVTAPVRRSLLAHAGRLLTGWDAFAEVPDGLVLTGWADRQTARRRRAWFDGTMERGRSAPFEASATERFHEHQPPVGVRRRRRGRPARRPARPGPDRGDRSGRRYSTVDPRRVARGRRPSPVVRCRRRGPFRVLRGRTGG